MTARLRILIASIAAPVEPLNGMGLPLQHVVRHLGRDHSITLFSYRAPAQRAAGPDPMVEGVADSHWFDEPESPRGIARGLTLARQMATNQPFQMARLPGAMAGAVKSHLETNEYDVVHLHGPWLAPIAADIPVPSVCFAFDAWHRNASAQTALTSGLVAKLRRDEERRIRAWEARVLRAPDEVTVVSQVDADALEPLLGYRPTVITNGVDGSFFEDLGLNRNPRELVFVGNMSWEPNIQAVDVLASEVMPLIARDEPSVRLRIVGRDVSPTDATRWKRERSVEVVGEVDDVRPYLQTAGVFLCPMRSGTGIKNKLLEAFASGVPVVASSLATQGIQVSPGTHVAVEDQPDGFAKAVVTLIRNTERAAVLAAAARQLVDEQHRWAEVAASVEALYQRVVDARSVQRP